MNLNFRDLDIAGFTFSFVRTLMVMGTSGAELTECLHTAGQIKDNDIDSWICAWAQLADTVLQSAEGAQRSGQTITARQAYLRASNYYRAAMFYLAPSDDRLNRYIQLSREFFQQAARLFAPPIETLEIAFGEARLPAYFLRAGGVGLPTLIAVNGGDSTNEELVHWIGWAAVARGWNCLVFEGPGQWSALQLNPGLFLRPDYEAPVGAVVDYVSTRPEVDSTKLALIGYSLGASLAARAAAFEKRVRACICDGLVVDVNEAWTATLPRVLRSDSAFGLLERLSPQARGLTNHFRWMFGVSKPSEIFAAWPAFSIKELAPQIACPVLLLYGEEEFAETNATVIASAMRFIGELAGPSAIHLFPSSAGWAASHCQVGGLSAAQSVIFHWLERTLNSADESSEATGTIDWEMLHKHHHTREIAELEQRLQTSGRVANAP